MARHRVFLGVVGGPEGGEGPGEVPHGVITLEGAEAEHAIKSKRVRAGDEIEAFDGRGTVLRCRVARAGKHGLELAVVEREEVAPVRPAVEVWSATPKGPRLDKMIDMLAQVGAASWTPMDTKLGVVDPGAGKIDRMVRISIEAAKQCGRAHVMEIERKRAFADALEVGADTALVVADASGGSYEATGRARVRVLIGPEGGLVEEELEAARGVGAQVVSLGPHAMRIETAAVVAAALVMARERRATKIKR